MGEFDFIAICEGPDDAVMARYSLQLGGLVFVRTKTLKAVLRSCLPRNRPDARLSRPLGPKLTQGRTPPEMRCEISEISRRRGNLENVHAGRAVYPFRPDFTQPL
jgi:hypothetical protein